MSLFSQHHRADVSFDYYVTCCSKRADTDKLSSEIGLLDQ